MHLTGSTIEITASHLVFAGTHRRAENVRPHAHPYPELIFIKDGECDLHVGGQVIHAAANDVVVMPARLTHDQVSEGFIDTVYCGFVEPHAMNWTQPRVISLLDATFIEQCMQLMAAVHCRQIPATPVATVALLTAVLEQLNHHHLQQEQEDHIPTSLRAILQYINGHLNKSLTIDTLSESTRMSASNLYLLFRTHLNTSPMRYIRDQRMRAARRELQSPYSLIKEVAVVCGYPDVNHFVRTFRKAHGLSPGQWRQQQIDKLESRTWIAESD